MAIIRFSLYTAPARTLNHSASDRVTNKVRTVMMCAKNHVSLKLQIRSNHRTMVFEDRLNGVVCYKDENGEITCEGYDEGPRFQQQISLIPCNSSSRDVEIIDLLQRCWVHVAADVDEFKNNTDSKGVEEDFNSCNGSSNKLC